MSNDVLKEWRVTAQYWARYCDTIRTMFEPLTRALIERTGIRKGQSVLDIAGGAGEPAITIAETIAPTGSVTCTDAVLEMVEAARAEASRRGVKNIQFRQCTADELPFPDESFDAVVCRLGAMFFPDPLAAVREMLRVAKPNGSLGFIVWHKSEVNPFCYLITRVIDQHIQPAVADHDAPNAFRFAEPGKLAGVLKQAGAVDIQESVIKFDLAAPISPLEFWTMRSQTSDTLREKLKRLPTAEQSQVAADVEQSVKEFFPANQMNFPAQMILVTGKKPN